MNDLSAIIATAKSFTEKELRPRRDALDAPSGAVLPELLKTLAGIGFFSMMCAEEDGGAGQGAAACAAFIGEVSRVSPALGTALASHAMGLIPVLVLAGEIERKETVRKIIESEEKGEAPLFTLCWMEDAARLGGGLGLEEMETEVEGSGGGLTLRGRKLFAPAAEAAKNLTVLLKLEEGKFAFVCVPAEEDGVAVGGAREMMGLRLCPFNDVVFDRVKILKDNVLSSNVSAAEVRKLFARFEACLGAVCVGMMREAYAQAISYAAGRYQAGKMIIGHDAVREMLAGMAAGIEKSRSFVARAAADADSNAPTPASLLCSVTAAEEAVKAALDGIQILGGYGYMRDYPLERILRDAKTFQTTVVLPQCRKMEFIKSEV